MRVRAAKPGQQGSMNFANKVPRLRVVYTRVCSEGWELMLSQVNECALREVTYMRHCCELKAMYVWLKVKMDM